MTAERSLKKIAVVGGGLAGFAAAATLAKRGLDILHVAPEARPDRRTSALMEPSVYFLVHSGLIDDPGGIGTPLTRIRIIDATGRLLRAPETLFDSTENGQKQFGWNFTNTSLLEQFSRSAASAATYNLLASPMVEMTKSANGFALTLQDGTEIACDLVVGADGKQSPVREQAGIALREHRFSQCALVCDLELERPIGGTSVEFHYPNGPFTLVPAGGNKTNLVWIDENDELAAAQKLDHGAMAELFAKRSKRLFGKVKALTPAVVFPLSVLHAETAGRDGVVLLGEAAHAFPPIGAQGLNLSLRDVAALNSSIEEAAGQIDGDWADAVSRAYATARQSDLMQTASMVEALFRSLLSDLLPAQALRAAGLWALKLTPSLRRKAFAFGMGVR